MAHLHPLLRALTIVLVVVLVAGGCSGGDDGDLEAYCDLVRAGVGVDDGDGAVAEADYQQLLDVAPPEVEDTVQELTNTSRDLADIVDLEQLFSAAFDPDAQAARIAFIAHAVENCGIDAATIGGAGGGGVQGELTAYLEANFGNETWSDGVRYDVVLDGTTLDGVTATFIVDAVGDEPVSVCNAIRPWLYDLQGASGAIEVRGDDLVLARSSGPDATCVAL